MIRTPGNKETHPDPDAISTIRFYNLTVIHISCFLSAPPVTIHYLHSYLRLQNTFDILTTTAGHLQIRAHPPEALEKY
jgi:hypothetical protein